MSRTNIDIDDELIARVMEQFALKTKKDAVDFALRRLARPAPNTSYLQSALGMGWSGNLEEIRGREDATVEIVNIPESDATC